VLRAILLITIFVSIGWADTWETLKVAADKVTSVSADFTQEKHMKILSRPLISEGVFYFQAPGSLRLEYRHPVRSVLLLHQGKTTRFVRANGHFVTDASTNLQPMNQVLLEITHWLKGRFDSNPHFSATLKPGRMIVLVPRSASVATFVQRIELIPSTRPGIIKSVLIYESEDSYTVLDFKNVVLNRPLDDSLFRKIE
jgi:outer membrane lipoprotein-sorting protein